MDKNAYFDGVSPAMLFVTQLYLPSSSSFTPPSDSWFCMMFLSSSKNWNDSCPWVWVCSIQIIVLDPCDIWLRKTSGRTVKSYIGTEKKQFCRGQLRLAKINTTQQIVCVQIPCILVNNDLHTKTYLATIRSCCFLLTPLLKTKLNKKRQKNHKQRPSNVHGVRNWNPRYIVSGAMVCKYTIQRIIHALCQILYFLSRHTEKTSVLFHIHCWHGVLPL